MATNRSTSFHLLQEQLPQFDARSRSVGDAGPYYCHERIEMLFSGAQQLSILQSFPFPITDRLNGEIFRERTTETFWNALIK